MAALNQTANELRKACQGITQYAKLLKQAKHDRESESQSTDRESMQHRNDHGPLKFNHQYNNSFTEL